MLQLNSQTFETTKEILGYAQEMKFWDLGSESSIVLSFRQGVGRTVDGGPTSITWLR